MKFLKAVFIVLFIAFIVGCGSSGGGGGEDPPSTKTTTVSGTVLDGNGDPIEGAEVTIRSNPVIVQTDANGFFSATVEIGTHTIEIEKDTTVIYSGQINIEENTPLPLSNITTNSGQGNGEPRGNKSASGTYSYNAQTQILTVNFFISNFNDCGPSVGTSTSTVSITSDDTMIQIEESGNTGTWSRTGGSSGNIIGTWTLSEDEGTLTALINSDGTLTVTGTIGCGGSSGGGSNASIVGTWEMTDIQGVDVPSELPPNAMVFTDLTYAVNIEGDCGVSGIYTSDVSSIWLTSTSRTGNTDSFCDYHDTPHRLGYSVTSSTLIITEGDVVITLTRQ